MQFKFLIFFILIFFSITAFSSKKHCTKKIRVVVDQALSGTSTFLDRTSFGQRLKGFSESVGRGRFKITSNVGEMRKGDIFYLDMFHKDHLEVFNRRGEFRVVLNLDGTINRKKTKKALKRYLNK